MDIIFGVLTVFALGAVELWAAIPAGFALGLNPVITAIAAAAGAMLGGLAVLMLGERARDWLMRERKADAVSGRWGRIHRIWQQYGVAGLGLLAPLLTGVPLAVAIGIALGAPAGRLFFWVTTGVILWSTVLTLAGALGLEGIRMFL